LTDSELPRYVELGELRLAARARAAKEVLAACTLCPHLCRVNRLAGERGFCGMRAQAVIASGGPHFGEERVLVGSRGSGAIFFSGCTLRCIFCQNWQISWGGEGVALSDEKLAGVMLHLAQLGCANINLVSPTHFVPQILAALHLALSQGLKLPLVYNTSGYELPETLALLEGVVDIYMPDIKYADDKLGELYSAAPDYAARTRVAVREMQRQVGDLAIDKRGLAYRGLLIRHLVMPGDVAGTAEVLHFIAREISPRAMVNIMAQYRPAHLAGRHPTLNQPVRQSEVRAAKELAKRLGLRLIES
jgi:putative pyruvate formate lyase activating enzyme